MSSSGTGGGSSFAPTFHPSLTQYYHHHGPFAVSAAAHPSSSSASLIEPFHGLDGARKTPQNPPEQEPPERPTRNKAKNRRKRHVPPGPAGVWFQGASCPSAQQQRGDGGATSSDRRAADKNEEEEELMILNTATDLASTSPRRRRRRASDTTITAASDVSRCLAWTAMQQSLNLCTPYLPPYLSISERYTHLLPHYMAHPNFILLSDLAMNTSTQKSMLLLVHAVQSNTTTDWTVELQDECGASIQAWLDPRFVQEEQQEQGRRRSGCVQMGHVWRVQGASLFVSTNNNQHERRRHGNQASTTTASTDWWLLIRKEDIKQVWTTQSSREWTDQQHLKWMEKRRALTSRIEGDVQELEQQQPSDHDDEGEDMEYDEVEQGGDDRDHGLSVVAGSQQFGAPPALGTLFQPTDLQSNSHQPTTGRAVQNNLYQSTTTGAVEPPSAVPATAELSPRSFLPEPIRRSDDEVTDDSRRLNRNASGAASRAVATLSSESRDDADANSPSVVQQHQPKAVDFSQFCAPTSREAEPALAKRRRPSATAARASASSALNTTAHQQASCHTDHQHQDVSSLPTTKTMKGPAVSKTPPSTKSDKGVVAHSSSSTSPKNPLFQYRATSTRTRSPTLDSSASNKSPSLPSSSKKSPMHSSGKKKRRKSPKTLKKKSQKATSPKPACVTSPKPSSSLMWSNMDASMIGILDEDDDTEGRPQGPTLQQRDNATHPKDNTVEPSLPPVELTTISVPAPSLFFQASAFEGMDATDLFDED